MTKKKLIFWAITLAIYIFMYLFIHCNAIYIIKRRMDDEEATKETRNKLGYVAQ